MFPSFASAITASTPSSFASPPSAPSCCPDLKSIFFQPPPPQEETKKVQTQSLPAPATIIDAVDATDATSPFRKRPRLDFKADGVARFLNTKSRQVRVAYQHQTMTNMIHLSVQLVENGHDTTIGQSKFINNSPSITAHRGLLAAICFAFFQISTSIVDWNRYSWVFLYPRETEEDFYLENILQYWRSWRDIGRQENLRQNKSAHSMDMLTKKMSRVHNRDLILPLLVYLVLFSKSCPTLPRFQACKAMPALTIANQRRGKNKMETFNNVVDQEWKLSYIDPETLFFSNPPLADLFCRFDNGDNKGDTFEQILPKLTLLNTSLFPNMNIRAQLTNTQSFFDKEDGLQEEEEEEEKLQKQQRQLQPAECPLMIQFQVSEKGHVQRLESWGRDDWGIKAKVAKFLETLNCSTAVSVLPTTAAPSVSASPSSMPPLQQDVFLLKKSISSSSSSAQNRNPTRSRKTNKIKLYTNKKKRIDTDTDTGTDDDDTYESDFVDKNEDEEDDSDDEYQQEEETFDSEDEKDE